MGVKLRFGISPTRQKDCLTDSDEHFSTVLPAKFCRAGPMSEEKNI
jgi:hypothetical protein